MTQVKTPLGTVIYPRETLTLVSGTRIHVERWRVYVEDGNDWYVASADAGDTNRDGIYFDSLANYQAGV